MCGRDDDSLRSAVCRVGALQQWYAERGCLARSGLRERNYVVTITQQKRYNFLLNRHRMFEAEFLNGAANLFAYAQFFKCLQCECCSLMPASQ